MPNRRERFCFLVGVLVTLAFWELTHLFLSSFRSSHEHLVMRTQSDEEFGKDLLLAAVSKQNDTIAPSWPTLSKKQSVETLQTTRQCSSILSQQSLSPSQQEVVAHEEQLLMNIPRVSLSPEEFIFLHIGKAGGGTFRARVKDLWNVEHRQCHPNPCLGRFLGRPSESNDAVFVISIRDPIDRFASAFYWRAMVLCHPDDGDTRKIGGQASANPDRYCKNKTQEEIEIIFHKRKQNINLLAEALCGQEEDQDDDATSQEAKRDMKKIQHAKHSIGDWLGDDWRHIAHALMPVVLEHNYDLNSQIDEAVHWINNHTRLLDAPSLAAREARVHLMDYCETQEEARNGTNNGILSQEIVKHQHSSSASSGKHIPLSPLGEKCLARYYAQDYKLLWELKEKACKSDVCNAAIKSILDRREHLLVD